MRDHAECNVDILGLLGALEVGSIRELAFLSGIYLSMDLKVTEGGPVGHKTGLSPLLPGL